ncbi:MAG: dTDP-4-dehydrorhamnose 3,5-epimerase [Ignavibacteria bacterium]|nr:dTDP-4-dehydrorhamnose 3,5-epimerase [Ignavibacteria bacterium]
MTILERKYNGLLLIEPRVFSDDRGFFFESYHNDKYKAAGIEFAFLQDNLSFSKKDTIRGLHYQIGDFAQGKLCQVLQGEVLDVAVDIRAGSPTYGKHYAVRLSGDNHYQLWIPAGFAHGFSVLSETVLFSYKCTQLYSKAHERSILYNDPDLGIDWQVNDPIVSEKDLEAAAFGSIAADFQYSLK